MSLPVFSSKLLVPSLSCHHLPRPRIDETWASHPHLRLVTVTAGAGWGKTTTIVSALRQEPRRVLWYCLDDADKDPGVFFAHLLQAEGISFSEKHEADEGQETSSLSSLLNSWRNHETGTVLVLDDLQYLGSQSPVLDWIQRLIRYLPPTCTVVLASRDPIPVPTTKLKNLGQALALQARDLSFSSAEIQDLFQIHFPGTVLTSAQLKKIHDYSEGWAAGLQIFFQALPDSPDLSLTESISRLGTAGPGWFEFFAEEVVSGMEPPVRHFLLHTAILPSLEAGLCDRVLGRKDSRQVLEELSNRNLFTFSTGDGQGYYRYHHLFREFLLSRVLKELGSEKVEQLRLKTGRVLASSKRWIEAVGLLAQCQDKQPALDLFAAKTDQLLDSGRFSELAQALESLGSRALNQSVETLFLLGQVQNIQGRWELAETTYRRALRRYPDSPRQIEIKSLIAQIQMRFGKYDSCLRLCRLALKSEKKIPGPVRARLLGLQGVSSCALGRLQQGENFLNEAIKTCRRVKNRGAEGRNLFLMAANIHYFRGEFLLAEETARQALRIFQDLDDRRLICHSLGVLGFVLVAAGRKTEAEVCSRDALRKAESLGYRNIVGYCHLTLGECSLLESETEAAQKHFKMAREIGQEIGEAALQSLSLVGLARVALQRNNKPAARRLARKAHQAASEQKDLWATAQACLVLGLASLGKPKTCAGYWNEATEILTRLGSRFELARLELWRLSENLIPIEQRPERIREFLSLIADQSYEFLLLAIEVPRAQQVLNRIPQEGPLDKELVEFVVHLKSRLPGTVVLPDETISIPLEIKSLGPLQVTVGDRLLTRKQWKSARAFRLFSYLLVHRFQWLVKDEIMEALWPDAHPAKASNNLRQTVFILRKTLSPQGPCPYIQLRDDTYSLQGGPDCRYDVLEFEQALGRAQASAAQGQFQAAEKALKRAVDLYQGSFLMEAPYEEFTQNERDHLHFAHQRVVEKLLEIYRKGDRWDETLTLCLQVLPLHPHHDCFHEMLIRAHLFFGHRKEALEYYRKYEKKLLGDLDLLPSDTLRKLAEQAAGPGGFHP